MRISSAHDGGSAVVRLAGRLDGESAQQLSEALDRLLRDGQRSVLFDMSEVTYLSSPGVHALQRAHLDLRVLVTNLFTHRRVRGVLHLLADDRGAAGAGESRLRRSLCWAAPVTKVIGGA
jgi:anti-anti-sigma factor